MSELLTKTSEENLEAVESIATESAVPSQDQELLVKHLQNVRQQLGRYDGTNALEAFLMEFIETARRGELPAGDDPDDDLRPELERALELDTLCRCDHVTCSLKSGKLPGQLHQHGTGRYRNTRSIEDELADFLREHPEAVVLQEAKTAWDSWKGQLLGKISRMYGAAKRSKWDRTDEDESELEPLQL